jgi:hypothetical protein
MQITFYYLRTALVTHEGWCRDKDGGFQQLSHGHETILSNCEKGCNTNLECDAFSYETPTPSDYYNCYHYKNGPYTAGSGRPDTKCYIVERGKFLLFYTCTYMTRIPFLLV